MFRSLIALLSSYGILLLANGLFGTLVSLRSKSVDFPDAVIGIVLAGYFAGLLFSSFYAARIVASIGHIRAFALFASLASTVALGHLLWVNPVFWGLLRVVSGICMGGMIVVTEGWLNERADNRNRGSILALYMITTYACLGASQLLIVIANPDGFLLFVIVSVLFSFALMPILVTQSRAPAPSSPARPNVLKLFRTSPVGMLGSFNVGVMNGIFYALAPIYARSMGLTTQQTAVFIAIGVASGMLLQVPLGRLSDRIDRRWVIAFSAGMTVVACYLLFHANGENLTQLYATAVFYGCVAFSINPICVAHVNDLASANERTQTASGLLMFYGIGAVLGPIVAGFTLSLGARYIFLISGTIMAIFCVYALLRLLIKPRHLDSKPKFTPYASQSPARRLLLNAKWQQQSRRTGK